MSEFEFVDRYGGNYPDPDTVCKGQCEGMGVYPQDIDDPDITVDEKKLWDEAHHAEHGNLCDDSCIGVCSSLCDGYHFIQCGDCKGTGLKP